MNDTSQHTSVEKALEFIAERYKYRGGADHVLAEIKVVSQKPGESAGDFGERVEALLNKLRNLYDTDSSLGDSQKITYGESGEAIFVRATGRLTAPGESKITEKLDRGDS